MIELNFEVPETMFSNFSYLMLINAVKNIRRYGGLQSLTAQEILIAQTFWSVNPMGVSPTRFYLQGQAHLFSNSPKNLSSVSNTSLSTFYSVSAMRNFMFWCTCLPTNGLERCRNFFSGGPFSVDLERLRASFNLNAHV